MSAPVRTRAGAPVEAVCTGVHRFSTPVPEADGTLQWSATTAVTVQVSAGGCTGPGWAWRWPRGRSGGGSAEPRGGFAEGPKPEEHRS